MTTVQIIIAVAICIGLLTAVMAGNWSIRHSLESQMKAPADALNEKVDRIDQVFQRLYQPALPGKGD